MRSTLLAFVLSPALLVAQPTAPLAGQSLADLIRTIQQGGGWVQIPIEQGEGSLQSTALFTAGFEVSGCFQVWPGNSGTWDIQARDEFGDGKIDVNASGGQPVPFSYVTGSVAQLVVDVRWSQPRDTTLLIWVGLDKPSEPDRDACTPVYRSGGSGP